MNTVADQGALKPGFARYLYGYENIPGQGYRRAEGFERRAPSASIVTRNCPSKAVVVLVSTTTALSIGNAYVGATSGAQGFCRALATAGSPAYYWLEKTSSSNFIPTEALVAVSGSSVVNQYTSETAPRLTNDWKGGVRAVQRSIRANLAAVPGSGAVLGVFVATYSGVKTVFAIRNNAGGTEAVLNRQDASSGAWFTVNLGEQLVFYNGNASVGAGDTLTQGGVTATIDAVYVTSGDPDAGTGAGILIISGRSGGSFGGGAATSTGGGALTLSGGQAATALPVGGRYEFVEHNFGGAAGTSKIYGVNGEGWGFQYSPGGAFIPILTGMAVDKPNHVCVHMNRLFLSFPKGSIQWSASGDPLTWNAIVGAGEIGLGDEVTALRSLKTDQLIVAGADRVMALYGSSFDVASFVPILTGTGAYAGCVADVGGVPLALDALGVYFIQQGQISGDYTPRPVSQDIDTEIKATIKTNLDAASATKKLFSIFSRRRWQYRLFSPNEGIEWRLTLLGTKPYGWSKHPAASTGTGSGSYTASGTIVCAYVGEDDAGNEMIYAGTDAGFVVQLDSGNSADGDAIAAQCDLVATALGAPNSQKRAHAAEFEVEYLPDGNGAIGIQPGFEIKADLGLGESQVLNVIATEAIDGYVYAPASQPGQAQRSAKVRYPCSVTGETLALSFSVTDDIDPPLTLKQAAYDVQVLGKRK